MPLNGGDRGEWSDVRPRRRKAQVHVTHRRDRLWEEQRHGGSRRQGQSRVRARFGYELGDYDYEDSREFCEQILSHDGKVILQYSRHDRSRGGGPYRDGKRSPCIQRRSLSRRRYHIRPTHQRAASRVVLRHRNSKSQERDISTEGAAGGFHRGEQSDKVQQKQKHVEAPRHEQTYGDCGRTTDKGMVSTPGAKFQDYKGTMLVGSDAPLVRTKKSTKYGQHQTKHNGTVQQNFVSFYFTNVLYDISYSSLRQGFEVCGIGGCLPG